MRPVYEVVMLWGRPVLGQNGNIYVLFEVVVDKIVFEMVRKLGMKRVAIGVGLTIVALCVCGDGLPVKNMVNEEVLSRGRSMMELKGMGSPLLGNVSSWERPSNISVNDMVCQVVFGNGNMDFTIFHGPSNSVIAVRGRIARFQNATIAAERSFGVMSSTNMRLEDFKESIMVSYMGTMTNVLHISHTSSRPQDRDVIVYKNLTVDIRGATNKLDFAMALINAGLPAQEQVSISSP